MAKILFLILTSLLLTVAAQAAAPVGQTIWLRASANGLFVSADQNRGTFAPLVADRATMGTWEQFTWSDLTGGAFTLRSRGTNRFVTADLNRGAALVSDRTAASTWEQFTWGAVGSQPPAGAPPGFPNLRWSDEFN